MAQPKTRKQIFEELHYYHAHSWIGAPKREHIGRAPYMEFFDWKSTWWKIMEKEFPEFIKNGVATCTARSTYRPPLPSQVPIGVTRKGTPILP